MVVLGSREQLCIHEEVSLLHGRTQTNACHSLCRKRKKRYCRHFPRVAGNILQSFTRLLLSIVSLALDHHFPGVPFKVGVYELF